VRGPPPGRLAGLRGFRVRVIRLTRYPTAPLRLAIRPARPPPPGHEFPRAPNPPQGARFAREAREVAGRLPLASLSSLPSRRLRAANHRSAGLPTPPRAASLVQVARPFSASRRRASVSRGADVCRLKWSQILPVSPPPMTPARDAEFRPPPSPPARPENVPGRLLGIAPQCERCLQMWPLDGIRLVCQRIDQREPKNLRLRSA